MISGRPALEWEDIPFYNMEVWRVADALLERKRLPLSSLKYLELAATSLILQMRQLNLPPDRRMDRYHLAERSPGGRRKSRAAFDSTCLALRPGALLLRERGQPGGGLGCDVLLEDLPRGTGKQLRKWVQL